MQIESKNTTRNLWHTFAAQATLLGISIGKNHWFGSFEAGALFTGRSFPDRCFNFAVGYRFNHLSTEVTQQINCTFV